MISKQGAHGVASAWRCELEWVGHHQDESANGSGSPHHHKRTSNGLMNFVVMATAESSSGLQPDDLEDTQ
jgi:hypothetical protein